jgi:hypothetical protein
MGLRDSMRESAAQAGSETLRVHRRFFRDIETADTANVPV